MELACSPRSCASGIRKALRCLHRSKIWIGRLRHDFVQGAAACLFAAPLNDFAAMSSGLGATERTSWRAVFSLGLAAGWNGTYGLLNSHKEHIGPGPQMWAVPVSLARKGTKASKRIYEIYLWRTKSAVCAPEPLFKYRSFFKTSWTWIPLFKYSSFFKKKLVWL